MSNYRFIITADDYGLSPLIDDAIEEAIEAGIVTSVAAFPNIRDKNGNFSAKKVAGLKKRHKKKISVGLHFTISSGESVNPRSTSLTKSKTNRAFRFFKKQPPKRATELEIEDELWAQIREFEATGPEIEHFSDHHGILSRTKMGLNAMIRVVNKYNEIRVNQGKKRVPYRNPMFIATLISNKKNKLNGSPLASAVRTFCLKNRVRKGTTRDLRYTRGQVNGVVKDMQAFNIPLTDYFVETLFSNADVKVLKRIFNTSNYETKNLGYDKYNITVPVSKKYKTVEIMVHLAYGRVSGGYGSKKYERLLREIKDYGLDADYLSYNRPKELETLKQFFEEYPENKKLLSTFNV